MSFARLYKTHGIKPFTLLAIPVITTGLGIWQIKRRKWKLNLIDNLTNRTRASPLKLENIINQNIPEYTKVVCEGRFLPNQFLYLGPRIFKDPTKKAKLEPSGLLSSSSNKVGYHLVQAFLLNEPLNYKLLVNRGWIPHEMLYKNFETTEGKVEGLVRNLETSKNLVNNSKIYQTRDIAMANLLNARPIFVDQAYSGTKNVPIGGQTIVYLRNEHLSYAITWFSLAIITLFTWFKMYFK